MPNSITHLKLNYEFNQPIDNLPNSITHLELGDEFNQSINNLQNSIIYLKYKNHNYYKKNYQTNIIEEINKK